MASLHVSRVMNNVRAGINPLYHGITREVNHGGFKDLLRFLRPILLGGLIWLSTVLSLTASGSFIRVGDTWRYFKGTEEPPATWNMLAFDDSGWLSGPTGIGYSDGDDATILDDMRGELHLCLFAPYV